MKIECCECKTEIRDPIWFMREVLDQMNPDVEHIHGPCRTRLEIQQEMWDETSHMLIAANALKIAAASMNEIGNNFQVSNMHDEDGAFIGAFTLASQYSRMSRNLTLHHEKVKKELEDLKRNSGSRN